MKQIVTTDDTRSTDGGCGVPTKCFYCPSALGSEHAPNCVCRKKLVTVRVTLEMVVETVESWDAHSIDFHRNESSWCASNGLREIQDLGSRLDVADLCPCSLFKSEYLRDATEDDLLSNALPESQP